jgi:hypothetical protein
MFLEPPSDGRLDATLDTPLPVLQRETDFVKFYLSKKTFGKDNTTGTN